MRLSDGDKIWIYKDGETEYAEFYTYIDEEGNRCSGINTLIESPKMKYKPGDRVIFHKDGVTKTGRIVSYFDGNKVRTGLRTGNGEIVSEEELFEVDE